MAVKPIDNLRPHHGGAEPAFDWETELKSLLKAELARRNMKYPDLVKRLAGVGISENEANLRNKISRGNFSAVFLLQCLMAIGVTDLRLRNYPYPPGRDPAERARQEWIDDEYNDL